MLRDPSTISNISQSPWQIKANFFVNPPWVERTKVFFAASGSHDQDGRHALKNLILRKQSTDFHESWYVASGTLAHHIVCSNDDPRLTLTYFAAMSFFVTYAFL